MNNILSIFIIILSVKCVSTPYEKQVIVDPEFLKIINQYMNEFNKIPNNCNAKPYYEIYFTHQESNIGFLISAYLGKPGKVPIPGEEEWSDENPIEIKGTTLINNNPVVIYDFIKSTGYKLYDPKALSNDNFKHFEIISLSCSNVKYPEGWGYIVTQDSLYFKEKRNAFTQK